MIRCACRWLLAALLAWACPVSAHSLSVAHVDIQESSDGRSARIEVDLALRDLALALPLDADHDERVTWGEVLAIRAPLEAMLASGLSLSRDAGACRLQARQLGLRRYDDGAYATVVLAATCPPGRRLRVHYGLLFAQDPQHRALVTRRNEDGVRTAIARAGATEIAFAPDAGHPFPTFVREGIGHILAGYDHLAFLLSLLLPAALVRIAGQWRPSPSLRSSMAHVLGVVTAFTVAHSLTLALAALGWVKPAARWVEVAIAASVALAALNNLRPLLVRRVWLAAFGFGLVHGFGFAGALLELGLPRGDRLAALLGFNVGVELGQLAVVAVLLPVLFAWSRQRMYARWVLPAASLVIALLAAYWMCWRLWTPGG